LSSENPSASESFIIRRVANNGPKLEAGDTLYVISGDGYSLHLVLSRCVRCKGTPQEICEAIRENLVHVVTYPWHDSMPGVEILRVLGIERGKIRVEVVD